LIWATPFLAILHPAPWLIVAAVFAGRHKLRADSGTGWEWFYGGLVLALLLMIISTAIALLRWHRHRRNGGA
jgi:hypothetical protein